VICYERPDGLGFGVSGVVTRARGIRASLPNLPIDQIPMAAPVKTEKVLYLLDPIGASRRARSVKALDFGVRKLARPELHAIELPWTPEFLHKTGGLVLSIGQLNQ
jgi:electron-transferring-flavoprotein dehydrogenase